MALPLDEFGYLHSSGRFSRTPASVIHDLDVWEDDPLINLETFTEFSGNKRRRALREPGWALFNGKEVPGADDCVIRWKTNVWEVVETDVAIISTVKTWRTNGKPIPPQYLTTALLRHRPTRKLLLVSVSHLPSHVEVAGGLRKSHRSAKWRDAIKGWKVHERQLRRKWGHHGRIKARIKVADWNVSFRAAWFRRFLKKTFPGMTSAWVGVKTRRGTLGRRIIDIPLLRGLARVSKPVLLREHKSSDHTAFKIRRLKFR